MNEQSGSNLDSIDIGSIIHDNKGKVFENSLSSDPAKNADLFTRFLLKYLADRYIIEGFTWRGKCTS